jgi:hypothetical protein
MQEDRMQVLKMLEAGKVNAEEAARLIDALAEVPEGRRPGGGKMLRIQVTEPGTNKKKVNLRIPLGLAKIAAKFIPPKKKKELAEEGIDIDDVLSKVTSENIGKIVDIESDEGLIQITID